MCVEHVSEQEPPSRQATSAGTGHTRYGAGNPSVDLELGSGAPSGRGASRSAPQSKTQVNPP